MQEDYKSKWSISKLAQQLRAGGAGGAGGLTCVELTETCLACIDEREPQLHAWVVVDGDGALSQAKALDEKLAWLTLLAGHCREGVCVGGERDIRAWSFVEAERAADYLFCAGEQQVHHRVETLHWHAVDLRGYHRQAVDLQLQYVLFKVEFVNPGAELG